MRFVSLLLLIPALLAAELNSDGDVQLWVTAQFEKGPIVLTTQMRIGDDISRLWLYYGQLQWRFDLGSKVSFLPGYRETERLFSKSGGGFFWASLHEPMADLTRSFCYRGWDLSARFRTFYRYAEAGDLRQHAIFRFRGVAKAPWVYTPYKLRPLISQEFFFRKNQGLYENRLAAGVEKKVSDSFSFVADYQWVWRGRDGDWNVLRCNLFFDF